MKKPELIIIRGIPGSGKSTLARKLKGRKKSVEHFETDMYWIDEDGEYNFDYRLLSQAHEWCLSKAYETIQNGKTCIVSNTFTTYEEVNPYVILSDDHEIKLTIITCIENWGSDKFIPAKTIDRMIDRWEDSEDFNSKLHMNQITFKDWDGKTLMHKVWDGSNLIDDDS